MRSNTGGGLGGDEMIHCERKRIENKTPQNCFSIQLYLISLAEGDAERGEERGTGRRCGGVVMSVQLFGRFPAS